MRRGSIFCQQVGRNSRRQRLLVAFLDRWLFALVLAFGAAPATAIPPPPGFPLADAQLARLTPFIGHWHGQRLRGTPESPEQVLVHEFRDVRRVTNLILVIGGIENNDTEVVAIDANERSGELRVFLPGIRFIPERPVGPGAIFEAGSQTCLQWEISQHYSSDRFDRWRRRICVNGVQWTETLESVDSDGAAHEADRLTLRRNP